MEGTRCKYSFSHAIVLMKFHYVQSPVWRTCLPCFSMMVQFCQSQDDIRLTSLVSFFSTGGATQPDPPRNTCGGGARLAEEPCPVRDGGSVGNTLFIACDVHVNNSSRGDAHGNLDELTEVLQWRR